MAAKKPVLELKRVLAAIDSNDYNFYSRLSDEEKKAFSPWLMMRYCSSVQGPMSEIYLLMTNKFVNRNFNDLSKHPELLWKLLALCGMGKSFHQWIRPGKKGKKDRITEFLEEIYPSYNSDEINLLLKLNTKNDLRVLAKSYGYQDNEIKEIFK